MVATHTHCQAMVRVFTHTYSSRLALVVAFPAPVCDSRACRGALTQAQG
jgi:hypothetical protein